MKSFSVLFIVLSLCIGSFSFIYAIDIVDRLGWGADPEYLYVQSTYWQEILAQGSGYEASDTEKNIHAYVTETYPDYFDTTEGIDLWEARELVTPVKHIKDVKRIIVHHTASVFDETQRTEEELVQDIYKHHALTNKWGDIGYNFIIGPSGAIYEGRLGGGKARAFHTAWNNEHSIGIALVGNFDIQDPSREQLLSLVRLSMYLKQEYRIQESSYVKAFRRCWGCPNGIEVVQEPWLIGHQHAGHTACPGKNLVKWLPVIRKFIESK